MVKSKNIILQIIFIFIIHILLTGCQTTRENTSSGKELFFTPVTVNKATELPLIALKTYKSSGKLTMLSSTNFEICIFYNIILGNGDGSLCSSTEFLLSGKYVLLKDGTPIDTYLMEPVFGLLTVAKGKEVKIAYDPVVKVKNSKLYNEGMASFEKMFLLLPPAIYDNSGFPMELEGITSYNGTISLMVNVNFIYSYAGSILGSRTHAISNQNGFHQIRIDLPVEELRKLAVPASIQIPPNVIE